MAYDFCLKKKLFGGLDPDSVTEYITKIKAENNLLKKELAGKPDEASFEELEILKRTVDELNSAAIGYKQQIEQLNKTISSLEEKLESAQSAPVADTSKIAVESLNIANHYFSQAVTMANEVSESTILSTEKSKETLMDSLDSLAEFEKNIISVRAQINTMLESFDDVSGCFEQLKGFENRQVKPVSSAEEIKSKTADDKAKLSLVD